MGNPESRSCSRVSIIFQVRKVDQVTKIIPLVLWKTLYLPWQMSMDTARGNYTGTIYSCFNCFDLSDEIQFSFSLMRTLKSYFLRNNAFRYCIEAVASKDTHTYMHTCISCNVTSQMKTKLREPFHRYRGNARPRCIV